VTPLIADQFGSVNARCPGQPCVRLRQIRWGHAYNLHSG
jgi:hypothetical protein